MAKLTDTERKKIVERLAAFESPAQVQTYVAEKFGKEVPISQVTHYDPTRSDRVGDRWVKLFEETRKAFLKDLDRIPLNHRAVRLREIQRLYKHLTKDLDRDGNGDVEDVTEAARLLKQAAKEVGEKFTNIERKEHSGPEGEPMQMRWVDPDSVDNAHE